MQADSLPAEPQGKPKNMEWVAYPFSSGSSQPRDRTGVSCIACGFFANLYVYTMRVYTSTRLCPLESLWLNILQLIMPLVSMQYSQLSRGHPVRGSVAIWLWLWLGFTPVYVWLVEESTAGGNNCGRKARGTKELGLAKVRSGRGNSKHPRALGRSGPADGGPQEHIQVRAQP